MQVLFVDDHGRIGHGMRDMRGVRLLPPALPNLRAAVDQAPPRHDAALAGREPR